jgi:hypothetical protein
MRKMMILSAIAIIAFVASPVLAQTTFTVSGHLATPTAGRCALPYAANCPSDDACVCYAATKPSLHTASGGIVTIPPGVTKVQVSVDTSDKTSTPGCKPAWGEVQYTADSGPDTATVEFFASLCPAITAGQPLSFSGGGALTNSLFEIPSLSFLGAFSIDAIGTATGTYSSGAAGQNLTLNLTANIPIPSL